MTAKMKSKPHRKNSRRDWERVRVTVMRWCLRVKLAQNWAKFSELLLSTENRAIVEESRRDDFWGAKPVDERTLVGMNVLGRLLMELREAIRSQARDAFLTVDPPELSEFLLFGRRIGTTGECDPAAQDSPATVAANMADRRPVHKPARQASLFDGPSAQGEPMQAYNTLAAPESTPVANLKPYPAMEASGVPWLGKVPVGWEVRRNGRLFAQRNETGFPDLPILEVSLRTGVRVREFDATARKQIMTDRAKYKRAMSGDVAYNMMRMWQGAVGVVPVDGLISPAYVVARPLPGTVPRYFAYLYRTGSYMGEVDNYSRGIVKDRNRLYWEQFKQIPTPYPPPAEQSAIVRFLDYADRRIRRYVRAKQRLIELLEEQKQAIIHRAVTRGLDPNVRLKPSGVEWLGDVPEHWEVTTIGRIATSFRTGPFGSILHQSDYVEGATPLVNPTHMNAGSIVEDKRCCVPTSVVERLSSYVLAKHDLVFSRRGELGRCALVRDREAGWLCGTGSIRVRIDYGGIEPEYLIEALQVGWVGEYLSLFSIGATMDSLNTGILKGVPVLLPPLEEQRRLLTKTARFAQTIRQAIEGANREIGLLGEYRTRLIADVVTGKLDVREAAARLPEEVEEAELLDETGSLAEADDAIDADLDAAFEEGEA